MPEHVAANQTWQSCSCAACGRAGLAGSGMLSQCGSSCWPARQRTMHMRCPLPAQGYVTADVAEKEGLHKLNLSGTKFRKMLRSGEGAGRVRHAGRHGPRELGVLPWRLVSSLTIHRRHDAVRRSCLGPRRRPHMADYRTAPVLLSWSPLQARTSPSGSPSSRWCRCCARRSPRRRPPPAAATAAEQRHRACRPPAGVPSSLSVLVQHRAGLSFVTRPPDHSLPPTSSLSLPVPSLVPALLCPSG